MIVRFFPRPNVLRKIPLDRPTVIEASAGTGKTFTLEHLVVEILLTTGTPIERILVVTFTEKASRELRARLRAKLEELTRLDERVEDARATSQDSVFRIDDDARNTLTEALRRLDVATIATIHSFCQRVLQENAFSSGRLFEERHVDAREMFGRAFRQALRNGLAKDNAGGWWLRAAVGAGCSATKVEELIWECARAHAEMRPHVDEAALRSALDAFSLEDGRALGIEARLRADKVHSSTIRAIAKHLRALADAVEGFRQSHDLPQFVLDSVEPLKYLRDQSDRVTKVCPSAEPLAQATPPFQAGLAQTFLPAVRRELDRQKSDAGQYDFDDMLLRVDDALRGPRGATLSRVLRERWQYVAVDEFQDTDETQWSIFRRAFFEPEPPRSVVILIGDPKQSIYRFRGADVHTYLRARATTIAHGAPLVRLEQNFRATPALVDAQNVLFDARAPQPIFTGENQYSPVEAGHPLRALVDGDGQAVSPVHVLRFSVPPKGRVPLPELGARIAREVRLLTDDRKPFRLDGRPVGFADVMVLTRKKEEARTVGEALRRAGVPHAFYKEGGLYRSDQASDVLTLLRAIDAPEDRSLRLAAWLGPFFDVPLRDLEFARDLPAGHPMRARLFSWRALADRGDFENLFPRIIAESGIVRRLLFFATGERAITNILHLCELLLERARATGERLRDLVLYLARLTDETKDAPETDADVQRLESEQRAVQIMTIHKAKGLEAPIVFLAGGWSRFGADRVLVYHEGDRRVAWVGSAPDSVKKLVEAEEAEEGERLMYVALTRAMGRLYLPYALVEEISPEPAGSEGARSPATPSGAYAKVHRRLVDVLGWDTPGFTVEDVGPEPALSGPPRHAPSSPWEPPAKWLASDADDRPYARLREERAAAVVTSYTRLHRDRDLRIRWEDEDQEPPRSVSAVSAVDETLLRSTRISGIFLHELLERVPLSSFGAPDFASWRALPEVSALVDETMGVFRIERVQREHAERLVWSAFTTPVDLPEGEHIDGIARHDRLVREMAFVFACPASGDGSRVYARGSIDLAFEHDGRTYFVDWKSDRLASYERATLDQHVSAHYVEQVELYTLAVVQLLGADTQSEYEERFGGILYFFLRGLGPRGVWFSRPSWMDVMAWEGDLANRLKVERKPWA